MYRGPELSNVDPQEPADHPSESRKGRHLEKKKKKKEERNKR